MNFLRFRKRWREELGFKLSNHLSKKRALSLSNENLDEFYSILDDRLDKLDLKRCPDRIWNVDEIAFDSSSSNLKVFAHKNTNRVHKLTSDNEKISFTVNVCCNASGDFLPLYVLYPGKNMYTTYTEGGPDGCKYNVTENGWMTGSSF